MNALVIGYGSIGKRHTRLLMNIGSKVSVVSQQKIAGIMTYSGIAQALKKDLPDYIIIANDTASHFDSLLELINAGYKGMALIEKPLFHKLQMVPKHSFDRFFVGYNLRFHPILQKLKIFLKGERILSIHAYAGQYLPQWRKMQDYRQSYSADIQRGGGVLRDLSHELDYVNWLCDGWKKLIATGGHFSQLDINSDDIFSLLLETKRCSNASIHLNYLDRHARREMIIHTDKHTITADIINNRLQINENVSFFPIDKDATYRLQHTAILTGHVQHLCTVDEGIDVLRMIEAAEESTIRRKWIAR